MSDLPSDPGAATGRRHIAILGTVGLPGKYGGFETLAENLVRHHDGQNMRSRLTVYCSSRDYPDRSDTFLSAELRYLPFRANGVQSIVYDGVSLVLAPLRGSDAILLLGVSGAIALPLVRLFSRAHIVTNIDGIEWRREKWGALAKRFLRLSEYLAVRFSHEVIADNGAIGAYVRETYGTDAHVIAYGGDHASSIPPADLGELDLPDRYALALCRIEPENNVHTILEAFAGQDELPLVFIGNWKGSSYGRELLARYHGVEMLRMMDPIYDVGKLATIRSGAEVYVHGHSAGGTNPSLVEIMHFAKPVLAYDCDFNRWTTDDGAGFFKTPDDLRAALARLDPDTREAMGAMMGRIAQERYTWSTIAPAYFELLG